MSTGHRLPARLGLGCLVVSIWGGCGPTRQETPPPAPAVAPRPTLRIAALTDVQGTLEPCGCTSRPLGGIDRVAALLADLRQEGPPVVAVAAGDFLFRAPPDGAEGAPTQELWQAETLAGLAGESLGLAAVTPGARDFAHGVSVLEQALSGASTAPPWLLSGVAIDGENASSLQRLTSQSSTLIDAGGVAVGLLGVADLGEAARSAAGRVLRHADPIEAAAEEARALRSRGARLVVGLVSGDRRFAREAAARAGADLLILGGLDQREAAPPSVRNGAVLLHAGRQAQRLLVVDLYLRGEGPLVDASPWSREVEREELRAEAEALEARIAGWQAEGGEAAEVEAQRERLAGMRARLDALEGPPAIPATGNAFAARLVEIGPEVARDSATAERMRAYDRRVNEHNRVAFAGLRPPAPAPGAPTYVGSAACGAGCHDAALAWWRAHPHGRAYATLEQRFKEYNLACVGCHVTGYGQPGGATVTHNLGRALVDVGCESCHGPGSQHAAEPETHATPTGAEVPEDACRGCHSEDHSDQFVYSAYRAALRAPGHGLPSEER